MKLRHARGFPKANLYNGAGLPASTFTSLQSPMPN
jgi:hypothetical protein